VDIGSDLVCLHPGRHRHFEGNFTLAGEVVNRAGQPLLIRLAGPAGWPYLREKPNPLVSARLGLAVGGLLGASAAWFLGRRRVVSA
jgi:hypothetical protein